VEAESASLRVDGPVYPRRIELIIADEGGIDDAVVGGARGLPNPERRAA
jgi:hypothetical protein